MNVFVAGATGVLGRRVVPLLAGAGHSVRGLSRSEENDAVIRRSGGEPVRADLFDRAGVTSGSAECHAILHLATSIPLKSRPETRDWAENDRIRTEGTATLLEAAARNGCRLYLQQSVCLLYGDRGGDWVDEDTPVARDLPALLRSAVEMERLVCESAVRGGPRAVVLRFGSFYGHDSPQTASMFSAIGEGKFPVPGNGGVFWNLVNLDDAAAAVVRAVDDRGADGPAAIYNVCDDEPVTIGELVGFIAGSMAAPPPRRMPAILARAALGAGLARALLASVRVSNRKAKDRLGWRPAYPTYREGMPAEISRWRGR